MERPSPGEYYYRRWYDITIYGYGMTEEEFLEEERRLGADEEELEMQRRSFDRWTREGYLFGKAYSVACPDGEYGLTPVRQAIAMSKEDYEAARLAEWTD